MNWYLLGVICLGLVLIAGVAVVKANATTDLEEKTISCSSCGGSCNAERNCGLSTCGAVTGTGSCGCEG